MASAASIRQAIATAFVLRAASTELTSTAPDAMFAGSREAADEGIDNVGINGHDGMCATSQGVTARDKNRQLKFMERDASQSASPRRR